MSAPVVDPHLSKQAQRFAPRAVVVIHESTDPEDGQRWRRYELERPGLPVRVLGLSYGEAHQALRVLQQAERNRI